MAEHTFTYRSELASEEAFLNDLERVIEAERLEVRVKQGLMLTLSEAFNNAMVHGNGLDPAKMVRVAVRVTESAVEAEISDEGERGLESFHRREAAGLMDDHGRGIALMEHYAGEVAFGESESGGLKVSVRFGRNRERVGG